MADIRLIDGSWENRREILRHDLDTYMSRDEQAHRCFVEAVKLLSHFGEQW